MLHFDRRNARPPTCEDKRHGGEIEINQEPGPWVEPTEDPSEVRRLMPYAADQSCKHSPVDSVIKSSLVKDLGYVTLAGKVETGVS